MPSSPNQIPDALSVARPKGYGSPMAFEITSLIDPAPKFDTVIDVRSPAEYAEDHVPGAINLPVLSNEERATVGTIYVQDNAFNARKIGAALVARNAAAHIEGPLAEKDGGWQPLVYCWRGGQRSGSFASILSQIGWRADTVLGGYQSYRRLVVQRLYKDDFPARVILLDGNTGTAKTALLHLLADRGVQMIDLEGLANHRGSALGGQGEQSSQKAFETRLARDMAKLDPDRPVVIEAESSKVGRLNIPSRVFQAMRSAKRVQIKAPVAARAAFLTRAYDDVLSDISDLSQRLNLLRRFQGHEKVDHWTSLAAAGDFQTLAEGLIREHYDPRYHKVRARHDAEADLILETGNLEDCDLENLADRMCKAVTTEKV